MKFRGSLKFEEIPFTPWSYKTKNYCWSCIIILISIRCIILQNCIAFEHWLSTFLIQMKIKYLAIKWVMALFLDRQFMKYLCTILQNNIQKCIAFENWLLTFFDTDEKKIVSLNQTGYVAGLFSLSKIDNDSAISVAKVARWWSRHFCWSFC